MEVLINYITNLFSFVTNNIIGIANVIVGFLLYRATIIIFRKSTEPELVFKLDIVNDYVAVGKLENIGKGIAYDIKVVFDPDFIVSGQNISNGFSDLKYLAPNHSYEIQYGYMNLGNQIIGFEEHTISISWTRSEGSLKKSEANFHIGKDYFKLYPRKNSLSTVSEKIEELKNTIEDIGNKIN